MLQGKVKFPNPLALKVGQLEHHLDHLVNGEGGRVDVGHLPHVVPRLLAILHLVCAGHDDNQVEYSKKMFLED